jgi:conjugal transfer pilus assembly protein TraU
MRSCKRLVAVLLLIAGLALAGPAAAGPTCQGRFMNPITDICWSCVFPLTIGSASLLSDGQNDIDNPSTPICYCNNPPRVGVTIGFWEPVRLVDVTRTPFCMVALGGIAIDPGIEVPRGAQVGHDSQTRNSFYHVHWYTNPILYWLEVLLDFPCLEQGALDLVYLTEVDPLWADDELTAILNPEAVLFANAPAKAACAADCVASSAGLGIASLFWCAGCQGSIYPMSGHVAAHIGGVQASALLTQRMTAKMHRQLATFDGAGAAGLCGYYMQPIMDKTHYKLQMVYPVPNTQKDAGQCCQPYGRTTMIWGAGKEFPVTGEDFRIRSSAKGTAVLARIDRIACWALACLLPCLLPCFALAQTPQWPTAQDIDRALKANPFPDATGSARRRFPSRRVWIRNAARSTSKRWQGARFICRTPGLLPARHRHPSESSSRWICHGQACNCSPTRRPGQAPCWCCAASSHSRCDRPLPSCKN